MNKDNLSNNPTVSFFTNCYEGDWEKVLIGDRLEKMIQRCNIDFTEKVLIINNVKDRALVAQHAEKAVAQNIIDAYHFAEDHSDEILSALSIKRDSFVLDFHDGYWYSMGPLAAIFFCKSKYLLYFTCDCMMQPGATPNWIWEATNLLQTDRSILAANPVWDNNVKEAQQESFQEKEGWLYSRGFSDQCFLIEHARFFDNIYNHYHLQSERYPVYGGNPFERRVDSYMHDAQLSRITNKHVYYIHEKLLNDHSEIRKFSAKKKIKGLLGRLSRKIRVQLKGK